MPRLHAHRRVTSIEAALIPVAEAIAGLLVEGDFSMVRRCESPDCTLWFYDRTKSHRRRWCSAALCGNRMKVAAFRARKK
jgi:predicted RNA-binding Zn ribbon-like protein